MSTAVPSRSTSVPSTEATPSTHPGTGPTSRTALRYLAAVTRLSIGWVFLWAFIDKTFALGFATGRDKETGAVAVFGDAAWLNGGSPTRGFLGNATQGPFADAYGSIAGAAWADWLFMIGLLGIGVALMLGIAMRIAAVSGAVLLFLMWTAVLPPATNPFMDDHLIYPMILGILVLVGAGRTLGLGRTWERLPIVERFRFLA